MQTQGKLEPAAVGNNQLQTPECPRALPTAVWLGVPVRPVPRCASSHLAAPTAAGLQAWTREQPFALWSQHQGGDGWVKALGQGNEMCLMFEGFFPHTVPLAQRGGGAGMQGAAAALHTCSCASPVVRPQGCAEVCAWGVLLPSFHMGDVQW